MTKEPDIIEAGIVVNDNVWIRRSDITSVVRNKKGDGGRVFTSLASLPSFKVLSFQGLVTVLMNPGKSGTYSVKNGWCESEYP